MQIGEGRENKTVGHHGLGNRNERRNRLIEFVAKHKVFITDTWFEQKRSARHTLTSPDDNTHKNGLHISKLAISKHNIKQQGISGR